MIGNLLIILMVRNMTCPSRIDEESWFLVKNAVAPYVFSRDVSEDHT